MATVPNSPIVNAGLLYVNGLQLTNNATTPNTKLDIAAGAARNSSDVNDIVLDASVTVNGLLAGVVNAVDVAALAASSFYYVYIIADSTKFKATGGLLSLSATPSLPVGYDMYRRIGYVLTDGSSHILKFWQIGNANVRYMHYDTPIATPAITTSANTYQNQSLAAGVPPMACEVILKVTFTAETLTDIVTLVPYGSSASNGMVVWGTGVAGVQQFMAEVPCELNSGVPTISYKTTADTPEALSLLVSGYQDSL